MGLTPPILDELHPISYQGVKLHFLGIDSHCLLTFIYPLLAAISISLKMEP